MVFARVDIAASVTLLAHSPDYERSWLLIHADSGPHLLGCWCRPPCHREIDSITAVRNICSELTLLQVVREPTRGNNLLDLVLTDVPGIHTSVEPAIADHRVVMASLDLKAPVGAEGARQVWDFNRAVWCKMREIITDQDWSFVDSASPTESVGRMNFIINQAAQ